MSRKSPAPDFSPELVLAAAGWAAAWAIASHFHRAPWGWLLAIAIALLCSLPAVVDLRRTKLAMEEMKEAVDEEEKRLAELLGEKQKLDRILSNLKEGILLADPGNQITFVNEEARRFLNARPGEIIGKSLSALAGGELGIIFQTLLSGEEKADHLPVAGSQTVLLYRTLIPKSADQTVLAKMAVLYDVTESKRLDDMRKTFVANASHELRSPAAALQSLLDAFQVGGLEERGQREKFIGMMESEVERLNAITQDLLELSELEREKEFTREPLKIAQLFADWLSTYETRARLKSIRLYSQFEDPQMTVSGSVLDLEKLFRNLMENAMKYTPEGGSIEVGLRRADNGIEGWVKDTGIGIAREHLDRIFERFYRVDQSRSRAMGGTGLGLSIAKHAVERHGGTIWAESTPGAGSAFWFTLPSGFPLSPGR